MIIGICFPNNVKVIDRKTQILDKELLHIITEYDNQQFTEHQPNVMIFSNDIKNYSIINNRRYILYPLDSTTNNVPVPDIAMYIIYMLFFGKFILIPPIGDKEEVDGFIKICRIQYNNVYMKIMRLLKMGHYRDFANTVEDLMKKVNIVDFDTVDIVDYETIDKDDKVRYLKVYLMLFNLLKLAHYINSEININIQYRSSSIEQKNYNKINIFVNEFSNDVSMIQKLCNYPIKDKDEESDMFDTNEIKHYTLDEAKSQLLYVKGEISKLLLENATDLIVSKTKYLDKKKRAYLVVKESTSDILAELACSFIGDVDQFKAVNFDDLRQKLKKNDNSK